MEKKPARLTLDGIPTAVTLYLDDLIDIFTLCKNVDEKAVMETCGYNLRDVNELEELHDVAGVDVTHDASFSIHTPGHFNLTLSGRYMSVHGDKTNENIALFTQIKELIAERARKVRPGFVKWTLFVTGYPVVFLLVLHLYLTSQISYELLAAFIIPVSLMPLALAWTVEGLLGRFTSLLSTTTIHLSRKSNHPSFIKRYKDQLLLIAIGAALGAAFSNIFD
nr:hypothetical protein 3 [Gammaproteobacteria bacterium]